MTADTIRSYDRTNLFTKDESQIDKASYFLKNWYEKLKKSLVDRDFKPSNIDPFYTLSRS